jgi:hypothetical protein
MMCGAATMCWSLFAPVVSLMPMSMPQDEELAKVIAEWALEEREAEPGLKGATEAAKSAALPKDEPVKDGDDEKTKIVKKTRRRL